MASAGDQKKIADYIATLGKEDQDRYQVAVAEGYKDEVCPGCSTVLLAFHHFIRCSKENCPMRAKSSDGTPEPSLLHQILGSSPKNLTKYNHGATVDEQ